MQPLPVREARLKPQFTHLYPALTPSLWMPAAALGRRLLAWSLTQPRPIRFGPRLLSNAHFEFRGGDAPAGGQPQRARRRSDCRETRRECRLRTEFAARYPSIPASEWVPAEEALVRTHESARALPEEERALPDEHFEFRGGVRRGARVALRTRRGDPEPQMA